MNVLPGPVSIPNPPPGFIQITPPGLQLPISQVSDFVQELLIKEGFHDVENLNCDLDNPIHPLFAQNKWEGVNETLYAKLKPALQLASLFITDDRVLDWFYRNTISDAVEVDADQSLACLRPRPSYSLKTESGRAAARKLWLTKLDNLGRVLKLHFSTAEDITSTADYPKEGENAYGFCAFFKEVFETRRKDPGRASLVNCQMCSPGWQETPNGAERTFEERTSPQVVINSSWQRQLT